MNPRFPSGLRSTDWKSSAARLLAGIASLSLAAISRAALSGAPQIIGEGHVDFSFCNTGGLWSVGLVWDRSAHPVAGSPASGALIPSALAILTARDRPFEEGGNRVLRPVGDEVWDFLGVGEQEPFWWFPQTGWAGVWPGFSVCTECGVPYYEEDPRIRAEGAWKTVQLLDVRYRGRGSGHYSAWSIDTFGGIVPWMSTADGGITDDDTYFVGPAGHSHPAMGFSSPGLYEVTFHVTCYGGPGKTNPDTSPPATYYFAVGTYWEWLARHFKPAQWHDNGVSGELADPDRDGVANLMEYACGLDPLKSDAAPHSFDTGKGLPELSLPEGSDQPFFHFPRRAAASHPQIRYDVRATDNPASGLWSDVPLAAGTPQEGSPDWESVLLSLSSTAPRRLLRLEVTLLPDPDTP